MYCNGPIEKNTNIVLFQYQHFILSSAWLSSNINPVLVCHKLKLKTLPVHVKTTNVLK